jgi:hypothetical protein
MKRITPRRRDPEGVRRVRVKTESHPLYGRIFKVVKEEKDYFVLDFKYAGFSARIIKNDCEEI